MSTEAIREEVFSTFINEFAPLYPEVSLEFQRTKSNPPRDQPRVYLAIIPGDTYRAEVGGNLKFALGVINVTCMVPENSGSKLLNNIADKVRDILIDRKWDVGGNSSLSTYGISRRDRGMINGYETVNIMCEYRQQYR
jgi:hypothetical protein